MSESKERKSEEVVLKRNYPKGHEARICVDSKGRLMIVVVKNQNNSVESSS